MKKIDELFETLKAAKAAELEAKLNLASMIENLKQSNEYAAWEAKKLDASGLADETEKKIKESALAEYARLVSVNPLSPTNKQPFEKVNIKLFTIATLVQDKIGALKAWCFENYRPALKLDEAKILDTAKKGKGDIPAEFFTIEIEPRAEIAWKKL